MLTQHPYIVPFSREVTIGNLTLGNNRPLVIQSMANTDTNLVEASVIQARNIVDAGGEMVRFTTQGKREVASLAAIRKALREKGITVPLVADVHFNPSVAEEAAAACEKVRINPGNFTGRITHHFDPADTRSLSEAREKNRKRFAAFLAQCRAHQTAIRIGVNHGSLSRRIMATHGDTPVGMAESAMEFLRICREEDFHNVVVSLKSSNTRVMIQSVRLLTWQMINEDLHFPIHLGVTEAGDGPAGRIRSATGMAPLLMEGMGDTLRVSLTESPEREIPVAKKIRELFPRPGALPYHPYKSLPWDPFHYDKPATHRINGVGGNLSVRVFSTIRGSTPDGLEADYVVMEKNSGIFLSGKDGEIPVEFFTAGTRPAEVRSGYTLVTKQQEPELLDKLEPSVVIYRAGTESFRDIKSWLIRYYRHGLTHPVVVARNYEEKDPGTFDLLTAGEFGLLLADGLIDGVWIENPHLPGARVLETVFQVLQASRARITQTEYIACPSCGRTLFHIEEVLNRVRLATRHLRGLKIAVMGCIVNGPGEMADADYGYVGSARGKVSLYRGKEVQRKNIPEEEAVDQLVELIREHGDWVDP